MNTRIEKLLTVEDVFVIPDRGLFVAPKIEASVFQGSQGRGFILLRRHGLEDARVLAEFAVPFVSPPPKEPFFMCSLIGLTKEDVPVGSEIWRFVESNERA